jgi:hypothetical protein
LPRGCYIVYYDGTNYYFRTDNKLTANITGDAGTVNGHTVLSDVPTGAKFTDENTTYTFTGGTNKFTVTPSGGTAQTVNVTPSVSLSDVSGTSDLQAIEALTGTSGFLKKTAADTWQLNETMMVILSYGTSTWNDFITAYKENAVVYCRASSNSNPATGS